MTCEERRELILLLAAGALDAAEEADLRRHLATGCPACAGALAEAESAFHQVPRSLPPLAPPESAWETIETRVALREQMDQPDRLALAQAERTALGQVFAPRSTPAPAPIANPKLIWLGWAIAAGVAVALGLPLYNAMEKDEIQQRQIQQLTDSSKAADALQLKIAELTRRLENQGKDFDIREATFTRELADQKTRLDALLRADSFPIAAAPDVQQPDVTGKLLWDKADNRWTIVASNVKPLPIGKEYELWIVTAAGEKLAAGTARPDDKGTLVIDARIPATAGPLAAAAFTDEKTGGVAKAEGQLQFLASVAKP